MGHMGEPRHPEVLAAIDAVIEKARENDVFVGMLVGDEPELVVEWIDKGAHWVTMGGDYSLFVRIAEQVAGRGARPPSPDGASTELVASLRPLRIGERVCLQARI